MFHEVSCLMMCCMKSTNAGEGTLIGTGAEASRVHG